MSSSASRPFRTLPGTGTGTWVFRKLLLDRMSRIRDGSLRIVDERGMLECGARTPRCDVAVEVDIADPAAYRSMALRGSIGAGESYMDGQWTCSDLTGLIRILVANRPVLDGLDSGPVRLASPLFRLYHMLRSNTISGSRRNIAEHYDLGNDFYRLFLDETLMYSCALFADQSTSLHQASIAKNELICRKLQLRPSDHLLEIGTGWGGFAIHAARHYGCRITTTTISREQWTLATQRIAEAGLADRVSVLLEDYRHLTGRYDKIVSIEMLEAVGHRYYDGYFARCSSLLNDDGLMLLQTITIAEQLYERAKHSVDFIQRYIFPGGCLPSVAAIADVIARKTDFRIYHLDDIGPHYATTLRHWRERFLENLPEVRTLGFSERFIRMWEFYLCYCEGGFIERAIGNIQMLLTKPGCRRAPPANEFCA
ncbi:MAG: cyclopropane-fatty-acyl-phospholipid synthase family protein [Methylotetracoccus sp.]